MPPGLVRGPFPSVLYLSHDTEGFGRAIRPASAADMCKMLRKRLTIITLSDICLSMLSVSPGGEIWEPAVCHLPLSSELYLSQAPWNAARPVPKTLLLTLVFL